MRFLIAVMASFWLTFTSSALQAGNVLMTQDQFLQQAFNTEVPAPKALWLTKDIKKDIRALIHREFKGLRLRYWDDGVQTAWILEEIGKTKPITTGLVIQDSKISRLQVLTYRESHGGEVRYPFFTDQFKGMSLTESTRLSDGVNGISGATLSVRALTKTARLALWLDAHVRAREATP
ncbi:MAG: FMN-binding protein [Parvibaculaceae bacterium]|nr:FMN-binding protein [Parvibaculaceae bacterium]